LPCTSSPPPWPPSSFYPSSPHRGQAFVLIIPPGRPFANMIGARPKEMFSKRTDTRKFTMEPHAYYDSAAELVESGSNDPVVLWRSKTRCSTFSEWMEVGSASDGLAAWRIESRFGDRCVPHSEGANSMCFITVLRVYRGYETKPQLLLVYRSHQSADITTTGSPKEVEVYLCNDDGADSMMVTTTYPCTRPIPLLGCGAQHSHSSSIPCSGKQRRGFSQRNLRFC